MMNVAKRDSRLDCLRTTTRHLSWKPVGTTRVNRDCSPHAAKTGTTSESLHVQSPQLVSKTSSMNDHDHDHDQAKRTPKKNSAADNQRLGQSCGVNTMGTYSFHHYAHPPNFPDRPQRRIGDDGDGDALRLKSSKYLSIHLQILGFGSTCRVLWPLLPTVLQ